jgi:hypothetical protein|tara:strand:+ start:376 stop:807 length:432 start_codon:yes stop_codon:yes gene_type:complete
MINRIKDLFRDGAKATGEFFGSFGKGDRDLDAMDPNPGGTYEDGKFKKAPKYVLDKLGKAVKDSSGYSNRKAAYDNYMNNLKMMKTGYQRLSGRIGMSTPGPKMATRVGQVGRATSFEDTLRSWNSRMRKFAVQRYYASLGKK